MKRYHATERAVLPAWPAMTAVRQCDIGDTRCEKAFASQCVPECLVGTLFGKKRNEINKWLDPF